MILINLFEESLIISETIVIETSTFVLEPKIDIKTSNIQVTATQ